MIDNSFTKFSETSYLLHSYTQGYHNLRVAFYYTHHCRDCKHKLIILLNLRILCIGNMFSYETIQLIIVEYFSSYVQHTRGSVDFICLMAFTLLLGQVSNQKLNSLPYRQQTEHIFRQLHVDHIHFYSVL